MGGRNLIGAALPRAGRGLGGLAAATTRPVALGVGLGAVGATAGVRLGGRRSAAGDSTASSVTRQSGREQTMTNGLSLGWRRGGTGLRSLLPVAVTLDPSILPLGSRGERRTSPPLAALSPQRNSGRDIPCSHGKRHSGRTFRAVTPRRRSPTQPPNRVDR